MSTMFGALNRFISRLDSESPSHTSQDRSTYGFQILRNKNHEIPIEPWYDFIVGINGRQVDNPDPNLFATEVHNCAGSNVSLILWNAKGARTRTIALPIPTPSPTLGITLQWTPLSITEDVWHVLDVITNSPADNAGLLPYGDYIVGTPEGNVHGESGLGELVEDYLGRNLRLFVYNHEYAVTRLVTLTPSRSWGGSGALGCVLGFGALHRLPVPMTEPIAGPGETLFETARFSNEEHRPSSAQPPQSQSPSLFPAPSSTPNASNFLVPASMTAPPLPPSQSATSPSAGPPKGAKKQRNVAAPNMTFDDYFREGEQKSKEEDYTPGTKGTAPLPPPPKSAKPPPQAGVTEPPADIPHDPEKPTTPEAEPRPESQDG
ncbi:MAG: hypothetical protein LQ352_007608 [Teloschistes flavicans]|nr:MAG: hypothetical protein LQ352_007608 [Teloschistes flavicans]